MLLAILSCHERPEYRQAQRETWLRSLRGLDYRFFLGRGNSHDHADEVVLDVPDDYDSLVFKLQATVAWAYQRGFDFIFKCDDDTYIRPERLLTSGFENHDYTGYCYRTQFHAIGGPGYWLSLKSMRVLLQYPVVQGPEDIWVYETLRANGIECIHDDRYIDPRFCPLLAQSNPDWISRSELSPQLLRWQHCITEHANSTTQR